MEKFQANDRPIYSKAYRLMQQISLNDATQRQLSSVNSINASSLAAVNEEIDKLLRTSKKRREKELLVALMGMSGRFCP
jgi:hypothetical protein